MLCNIGLTEGLIQFLKLPGKASEMGIKLERVLKKKYAAMRKENWYYAAKYRADEADLRMELEDLLKGEDIT